MTTKQDLIALAQRCEQATGPDRELSAEISLAVNEWMVEVEGNKPVNCRIRNQFGAPVYVGGLGDPYHYTASLDAAMTLVPEGWNERIEFGGWEYGRSGRWCSLTGPTRPGPGSEVEDGEGVTDALALCAAALRAQAEKLA